MSNWNIVRTNQLTRRLLLDLLNNEIGAICLPDFIENDTCQSIVREIYAHGVDYYKDKYPKVGKIGITQSEHKYNPAQKEEYFEKVQQANRTQRAIFGEGRNLLYDVIGVVDESWDGSAEIAIEKSLQQAYFAGLVRVINQARLHYDWAPLYDLGWTTDSITAQLTWNIYLQVGARGGVTRIYQQFGQRSDLKYVLPEGYFDRKVVANCHFIEVMPELGELVFFNSQNYHEVDTTEGDDERITFSSFIGLLEDQLIFWS